MKKNTGVYIRRLRSWTARWSPRRRTASTQSSQYARYTYLIYIERVPLRPRSRTITRLTYYR